MSNFDFTPEEQAANRAKLVAALRSGEYKQTRGQLRDSSVPGRATGYCCLGVACEISGLGGFNEGDAYTVAIDAGDSSRVLKNTTHLPPPVRRWLGFATDNGELTESESAQTPLGNSVSMLTDANDNGMSFDEIADLIEQDRVWLQ